jgi:isopentenyl diphosphate isomerase/L-lactate dehydrogenase-like FMN-dependent dehydrogenase
MAEHDATGPAEGGGAAGLSRRELMAGAAGLGAAMVGGHPRAAAPPPAAETSADRVWGGRQFEIYLAGRGGVKPPRPVPVEQLEKAAQQAMSPEAFGYVAGGAGSEDTMRANLEAFRRWRIVPRMLRDVSRRRLDVEVLGQRFPSPILLAPLGVQSIIHKEGELPVARAARAVGMPMVLSTVSSRTMEEVAAALGPTPRWFQLYWPKDPDLTASFVQRAERAGFGAIVVTLDTNLLGWRERDIQNAYLPFLAGEGIANYVSDPVFHSRLKAPPEADPNAVGEAFERVVTNAALTWKDLAWLKRTTRLPVILKGILDPEDARRALAEGVAGLVVSNHGGRQVDGAVAALDALPRVVEVVRDRALVMFDSGIRRGADVIKALALGARCVLLGRPYAYGLAVGGEEGVRDVLLNLLADLDLTLALTGCASVGELGRANLVEA